MGETDRKSEAAEERFRQRVARLKDAVLDWADARKVTVTFEEWELSLEIGLDGEEYLNWEYDADESDALWLVLDEALTRMRPAGSRCLPGGLTLTELDGPALEKIDESQLFEVFLERLAARAIYVRLYDLVTSATEGFVLRWTPETTREALLRDLTAPIEDRIAAIAAQKLSESELASLEKAPFQRGMSAYVVVALPEILEQARRGDLVAHWRLRNLLRALPKAAGPMLN